MENNDNDNLFSCLPVDPDEPQPCLLISQGENLHSHTFYSTSKQQYFERNIPEFHMKQVSWTSYGWLLMIDHSKHPLDCCLMNPTASKHKIQLPPIEIEPNSRLWDYQCVLTKPPTEPADCHVLLVGRTLFYCRLGDEKFIERAKEFEDDYFAATTNLNGKIYAWMGGSGNFVEVDFVGQELLIKKLRNDGGRPCQIPWPSPPDWPCFNDYLVDYSCNELLLVHMICYPHSGAEVAYFRIFKLNLIEREYEELMNIGDRTIFLGLSGNMSLLCTDKSGFKKNSIYYEWSDRNVHVYDIEDRSKTIFRACPINVVSQHFKSWIMI